MCDIICQQDKHLSTVIVTKSSTYDLGKVPNILLWLIYLTITLIFNENAKLWRSVLMMRCMIWYHLKNFKNVKNTHGEVSLLLKMQALVCNFTKSNTPPWVFFTFLKLHKWYQIVQSVCYPKFLSYILFNRNKFYRLPFYRKQPSAPPLFSQQ